MATIPILGNPDLGNRESLNTILQKLTADPGSPVEGHLFYRDDTDRVRVRIAGAWKDLAFTDDIAGLSNNSVTNAILADMATSTIKGRVTAATGDPEDLSVAQVRTLIGLGALAYLGTVGSAEITDGAIMNVDVNASAAIAVSKLAALANNRVLGNVSGSSASPAELTAADLSTLLGLGALATKSAVASADITDGTIATGDMANNAVTYAKLQDISATSRVLGRITAGAGDPEELTGANIRTILGTLDADTLGGQNAAAIVTSAVNTITGGAGAAYDTLVEIQGLLQADDTADALISTAVAGKNKLGVAADLGTSSADAVHNHALNTRDVLCQLVRKSDWKHVIAPYTITDVNNVTWNLDAAPSAGQYRSIIIPAIA